MFTYKFYQAFPHVSTKVTNTGMRRPQGTKL